MLWVGRWVGWEVGGGVGWEGGGVEEAGEGGTCLVQGTECLCRPATTCSKGYTSHDVLYRHHVPSCSEIDRALNSADYSLSGVCAYVCVRACVCVCVCQITDPGVG